jgi:hypothetical protein
MAVGGHFDFDNDHNVPRINGNRTLNKMGNRPPSQILAALRLGLD